MMSISHWPSIHAQNCCTPQTDSSVICMQSTVHCKISGGQAHRGVASQVA